MNSLFMVIMQLHTYADATQYTQSIFSFKLLTELEKTQMSQICMSEIINNPVLARHTQGSTLTHAMLSMPF